MEAPKEVSRTLVLLRKDVAPSKWHQSHPALIAEAEAGEEGVKTIEQGKAGSGDNRYWDLNVKVPSGWAAFRAGDHGDTRAFLHIQNY